MFLFEQTEMRDRLSNLDAQRCETEVEIASLRVQVTTERTTSQSQQTSLRQQLKAEHVRRSHRSVTVLKEIECVRTENVNAFALEKIRYWKSECVCTKRRMSVLKNWMSAMKKWMWLQWKTEYPWIEKVICLCEKRWISASRLNSFYGNDATEITLQEKAQIVHFGFPSSQHFHISSLLLFPVFAVIPFQVKTYKGALL